MRTLLPRRVSLAFVAALAVALAAVVALASAAPAAAVPNGPTHVEGTVRNAVTLQPIFDVCVTLGPPIRCATTTNAMGFYKIELIDLVGGTWELNFLKRPAYADAQVRFTTTGNGPYTQNVSMTPLPPQDCPTVPLAGTPTQTVNLPNVTKTLGGPSGFTTPFIVQNTGTVNTNIEVTFRKFSDNSCVTRRIVNALKPGTSYAAQPHIESDLPADTQFSVVVRSFGATIVAVVNQHAGSGARLESGSYTGASSGATNVFLPNIVKRFFGFVTPFIIQNLGTQLATATATFAPFDGSPAPTPINRTIEPGQSQFIDPNAEAGLVSGKQYAVTVTSTQPLSVVVNTHKDAPTEEKPVMYSMNGLTGGAATVYGPYAVKNVAGVGKGVSSIVVQNLGASPVTPTLTFTPLGGGTTKAFTGPSVASKASWAFDPRFTDGSTTKPLCGATATTGCLADGEYSFTGSAPAGQIAAVVNVIGDITAMGYTAIPNVTSKTYLPNVTRTFFGWSTPLVIHSVTATSVAVQWFRFSDGSLVTTQNLTFTAGSARLIDPRTVTGLPEGTQFAVVVSGSGQNLAAIVMQLNFDGGDGAMTYEGFAQ